MKALESAKELDWPFYGNLIGASSSEKVNYLPEAMLYIFCLV